MKKRIVYLILIALLVIGISLPVFASDTSTATHRATITISNSDTAETNVATVFNANATAMIANGHILDTFLNTAMVTSAGADVAYMPPQPSDNETWCVWVPSIEADTYTTDILYMGGAADMDGDIRYFPAAGGMTVVDNATIELSDNLTIEQSGWVDTDAGADKNLVDKEDAFRTFVSPTVIGNITSEITPDYAFPTVAATDGGNNAVNNTNHTVNMPDTGGIDAGDLLLVFFVNDTTAAATFPGGWTELFAASSTDLRSTCAYRIADGGEGATITVTTANAQMSAHTSYRITGYSGVPEAGTSATGGSTSPDPASLTPSWGGRNTLWFAVSANAGDNSVSAYPANYTNGRNDRAADAEGCGVGTARRERKAVSEDPGVFTTSGSDYWAATTVAVVDASVISVTATGVASGEMTVTTTQVDNTGAGWLAGWDNRIRIDIDVDQVDANVTHFPVLVYLSSSSGIGAEDVTAVFDEVGANHLKIAITQADGTTENYVEAEEWDNGAEEAWLWTSRSGWTIDSATDTTMYLYFDNDHADNNARVGVPNDAVVQNVWDGDYEEADHMEDGASNAATYDSTSNNNDGTKTGANEPVQATGQVGYAQDFDGVDDEVAANGVAAVGFFGGAFTMTAWGKLDDWTGDKQLLSGDNGAASRHATIYYRDSINGFVANTYGGGANNNRVDSAGIFDSDISWHFFCLMVDADGHINHFIIDTTDYGTNSTHDNDLSGITNFSTGMRAWGVNQNPWSGLIDEVRVSSGERSVAWAKATYYAGLDNFIDFVPNTEGYLVDYAYDLQILIDSVIEDRTLGVAVLDNANDWTFAENYSMMYMESTEITKGGTPVAYWDWEYADTFTDSYNDIVATPTFRAATSDADITAEMTAWLPMSEADAPVYLLTAAPDFITEAPGMTGDFTVAITPTYPGSDVIRAIAIAGVVPETLVTIIFASWILLIVSLCISYLMKKTGINSLFIKTCVITACMSLLVVFKIFDVWQVYFFVMIALALMWLSRQGEAY